MEFPLTTDDAAPEFITDAPSVAVATRSFPAVLDLGASEFVA